MSQDIYTVIEHLQGQVADISYVMLAAARRLAQDTGGGSVGVLLGFNAQGLTGKLAANKVLYVDNPALSEFNQDAYLRVLARLVDENKPRVILFGNTSIGADLASTLSARLGLPLVNSCQSIGEGNKLISKICGGKIMTACGLPETTTLVTVNPGGYKPEEGQSNSAPQIMQLTAPDLGNLRMTLKQYIEPEAGDVDISKEAILVSVGRGIQNQDNIELAEDLAKALGGYVCASRPIVDQGWLPASRMVGKSGKTVKPKLYLALGVSGAPEHLEGMSDSETIIAVNMDPSAPIFDIAQYGCDIDMFELLEPLIERIENAKG
jgi:electron transfer flavoprotein alpha subunit